MYSICQDDMSQSFCLWSLKSYSKNNYLVKPLCTNSTRLARSKNYNFRLGHIRYHMVLVVVLQHKHSKCLCVCIKGLCLCYCINQCQVLYTIIVGMDGEFVLMLFYQHCFSGVVLRQGGGSGHQAGWAGARQVGGASYHQIAQDHAGRHRPWKFTRSDGSGRRQRLLRWSGQAWRGWGLWGR